MKKIVANISVLAISTLMLVGCSDFLEREPYGQSTKWKTESDVDKAIFALYDYSSANWAEEICGRGHMWLECVSDNVLIGRDRAEVEEMRRFNMAPSNGQDCKFMWKVMYENNAKANNIILLVPQMAGLSQSYKNKAVGTAYFFRGFSMMWIVPYYGDNGPNGGIPIITDKTEAVNMDAPRPKSVLDNYDQIISDMRQAGELLPLFSELKADSEYGLPHKAAAWAYAARAALYAAQYNAKYYDIVIEMCDKIMGLSGADKRELYDDGTANAFANLWTTKNNYCKEYLFSIAGDANHGAKYYGVTFVNGGWGIYNTWGYFTPSLELYNAYEQGDARRDATILAPGQHVQFVGNDVQFGGFCQDGSISSWKTGHATCGLVVRKFIAPFAASDAPGKDISPLRDKCYTSLNVSLMRYAEVVLMKAEALIWSKGEGNAEAKALLNSLRKRAGLPQNSAATKAQLQNERRCELAFEFQPSRFVDVIRWGKGTEWLNPAAHSVASYKENNVIKMRPIEVYPARSYREGVSQVFPIPARAFNGTVNLKQNQGY
ncbi:MAG: RagB/SusD family nutrient uptake outer membrane protein [Alistipes sp.]